MKKLLVTATTSDTSYFHTKSSVVTTSAVTEQTLWPALSTSPSNTIITTASAAITTTPSSNILGTETTIIAQQISSKYRSTDSRENLRSEKNSICYQRCQLILLVDNISQVMQSSISFFYELIFHFLAVFGLCLSICFSV